MHCNSPNNCSECAPTYLVNSEGLCGFPCNVTNCLQCSSDNYCLTCAEFFSPISSGSCVLCPDKNCQQCAQENVCEQCMTTYNNYLGSCILC
jgi:hypothetical protein